jgi:uncharacterized membrane protein (DUF4010 family)
MQQCILVVSQQQLIGILIAALGGLAVGLEREWSGHASGPHARFAGVRTFTLLGILSGLSGWLWIEHFEVLAAVLLSGAAGLVVAAYVAASRHEVEATTEVAALVVLAAGLAAGVGSWALAGGTIAVMTLLLVEKSRIHDIARKLDDTSLRAAVRFGVMAVVILPLLPEGPFGPGAGFRPRTLWVAVLIFSGLSFAGYLARKGLSDTLGYPVAGLLGGLMSSTGVTFSFSRLSRTQAKAGGPLAVGVIGACTVLFLRVLVATATLNSALAAAAAPYFVIPFVVGVAATAAIWRLGGQVEDKEPEVRNPLQFWNSIQMAVLFQIVLYLMHWFHGKFGDRGLLATGAILGLTDVDALTLSMARGIQATDWSVAAQALSGGILSNTCLKTAVALTLGQGRFRLLTAAGLGAIGAAIVISILIF